MIFVSVNGFILERFQEILIWFSKFMQPYLLDICPGTMLGL